MRAALLAAWLPAALLGAAPARAEQPPLASLRGDVTVVAFWASWCAPCVQELPRLEALKARLPAGVRVVAVSVDRPAQQPAARALFSDKRLTLPLVVGGRALYERYFKRTELVVPRMVVIDRRDHGLMSDGFAPDIGTDDFIREILQAVGKVRGSGPSAPEGWQPLR